MKISKPLAARVGLFTLSVSAVVAPAALAASDTTPPTLNLPSWASFQVGATMTDGNYGPAENPSFFSSDVPMRVRWSASDASGICGYDVLQEWGAGLPYPLVTGTRSTSYAAATGTDYDGSVGGGSGVNYGWLVVAHDCAGNTTQKSTNTIPRVYTETGTSSTGSSIPVSTTGTWGTASCACWLGDKIKKSTARGASLSFRLSTAAGHNVALVTNTGPDRGSFNIYLDGVLKRTYNSYATAETKRNSVVAWASALSAGTHTIKIVNKGTCGHPRVDVDALLVN